MRYALINPNWNFSGSTYFGCQEPHYPLELLFSYDKIREAGGLLAGGHTIRDPEPKYGLAVIGVAHPDRLLRKGGARPGDVLLLTKALGTGLLVSGRLVSDPAKDVGGDLVRRARCGRVTDFARLIPIFAGLPRRCHPETAL